MILNIMDTLQEYADKAWKYIDKNFDNPFFWIVIAFLVVIIGFIGISKLADK